MSAVGRTERGKQSDAPTDETTEPEGEYIGETERTHIDQRKLAEEHQRDVASGKVPGENKTMENVWFAGETPDPGAAEDEKPEKD